MAYSGTVFSVLTVFIKVFAVVIVLQLAVILVQYLAQDSFGTACNVTGDGAIAVLVDALTRKKKI